MMQSKRLGIVAVLAGLVLGLSACSGGDEIAALNRGSAAGNQLPDYVYTEDIDVDSIREAVESEGFTYFLARGKEQGFCVIRTSDQGESAYMGGCGTKPGLVIITSSGTTAAGPTNVALVTDGYATDDLEDEGWAKIQENILVR
ncbi:hypothetical protein [Arthrobacter sedimenti]|uniref:hypothetical protein n=1 Tax=Arthrobacter sedimenti TaxID=2694931 RepID=UPI001121B0D2|nr:hypothetical protein [Arthrobacter sedimenti]